MHGIATMVRQLRADRGASGLVSGLGWYVTKHSIGIYSTTPSLECGRGRTPRSTRPSLTALPHPDWRWSPAAAPLIETYTVLHDRDGPPTKGIVIGRSQDGRRFVANTPEDRSVLEALMAREAIGTAGIVSSGKGLNRFDPA